MYEWNWAKTEVVDGFSLQVDYSDQNKTNEKGVLLWVSHMTR